MFENDIASLKEEIGKYHFVERYLSYFECMKLKYDYPDKDCCQLKNNLKAAGMVPVDR